MDEKIDLLSKMVVFHENVDKLEQDFRKVIASEAENVPKYTKEMFAELFEKNFIEHFNFEEKVIFPAILAWSKHGKYDKLINEYKEQHKELIGSGIAILEKIKTNENALTKAQLIENVTLFAGLNKRTCLHARHEDLHIVPLVKENAAIRFLTAKNMVALRPIFKTINPEEPTTCQRAQ